MRTEDLLTTELKPREEIISHVAYGGHSVHGEGRKCGIRNMEEVSAEIYRGCGICRILVDDLAKKSLFEYRDLINEYSKRYFFISYSHEQR